MPGGGARPRGRGSWVFLFFFFENRGCSWMPSNRVKSNVIERLLVTSKSDKQILKLFNSKNIRWDGTKFEEFPEEELVAIFDEEDEEEA